ncbi:MAG: twin-arginine translocase TatA/TatE family subunit [Verrucomicrobiota bacterium]|nr:twin-arginine translocase TatA/TatE family subunit [Verrucomicrobiota bacterium]
MNAPLFLAFLSNLAGPDLLVILLIILVLFGAKRLPDLARGMGQAMREFQKAKDDFTREVQQPSSEITSAQPEVPKQPATTAPPADAVPRDPSGSV